MTKQLKNQDKILEKLGIKELNAMQVDAIEAVESYNGILLLSPTGTGKTLAFLLPIVNRLKSSSKNIQALILVPSRELAIQIDQVARDMGSGYKTLAVYGGRPFSKEKLELQSPPAILIGTPGRVADHLRRESFTTEAIHTLILDEFDKSLEVGFEKDMTEIIAALPHVEKKMLTSATKEKSIPPFVGLPNPVVINYLKATRSVLELKTIVSKSDDKSDTLFQTLCSLGNKPGIIFCNFKESIAKVSDFLTSKNIGHGTFHGGMEQIERERALIKFRNGTHQIIVATDLASRGLDIPELAFIIHFELPNRSQEFTHRNGRTARMGKGGTAYLIKAPNESFPEFIGKTTLATFKKSSAPTPSPWKTLFVSGGRKDKISKGDSAGLFFKQGKCGTNDVGVIELKSDCAFVAVKSDKVKRLIKETNNAKLKTKKVRVYLV